MEFLDYSQISDDWLNSCFRVKKTIFIDFFGFLIDLYSPFHITSVVFFFLVFFCILSIKKNKNEYHKEIRSHIFYRLSLFSILNRFVFSYCLIAPLSLFFQQTSPCLTDERSKNWFSMPSIQLFPILNIAYIVCEFPVGSSWIVKIITGLIVALVSLYLILIGDISILQALITIFLVYVFHFFLMYAKYKWMHSMNIVSLIISSISLVLTDQNIDFRSFFAFGIALAISFEILLISNTITYQNFNELQSTTDLVLEADANENQYIKQVDIYSNEKCAEFYNKDLNMTVLSYLIFLLIGSILQKPNSICK